MQISSHPREFDRSIHVEIVSDNNDHCIISLINQKGRIRMMMGVNLSEGTNNIVVDHVDGLEMGAYELQVKNIESKVLYHTELIKQ